MVQDIFGLLSKRERWQTLIIIILAVFTAILETLSIGILIPALLKMMSGESIALKNNVAAYVLGGFESIYWQYGIGGAILLISVVYLFKNVFIGFVYYYQSAVSFAINARISSALFTNYLERNYAFFLRTDPSILIRNVYSEVYRFVMGVYLPLITVVSELCVGVCLLILLLRIELFGGLIFFAILAITMIGVTVFARHKLAIYGNMRQVSDAERLKYISEAFNGIKEIKVYGIKHFFRARHHHFVEQSCEATLYQIVLQHIPRLTLEFFGVFAILLFLFVLQRQNDSTQEQFFKAAIYVAAAFRLLPAATRALSNIQMARFEIPAVAELRHAFQTAEAPPSGAAEQGRDETAEKWGLEKLRFSNIVYRYGENDRRAVDDISLDITSGDFIGIVGESGSGKTSFLNIVTGLLTPTQGQIRYNGTVGNMADCGLTLSYVPQNTFMINDSIRTNIALGIEHNQVDTKRIWDILDILQLKDLVLGLSGQLDFNLGSAGVNFSGGQIQRIGIARALYANTQIIVFDEATSALDRETETAFLEAYIKSRFLRTTIFVSHRTELLRYCNKVLRLSQGRVVETWRKASTYGSSH
jgi:ABC-type bacteriocin/lantibiotic exporter with double-glycine peptidase domain